MTWERINLAAPEFAVPSEPPYLCGLLYRGGRHVISGPPESLKTVLAFVLGLEHLRATSGGWAHIDCEMGPTQARRLLADLGATDAEIASVYYVEPGDGPKAADIEAIIEAKVTLATVDAIAGAYDVSGLDDIKKADVEKFARAWIRPLWQQGIGTVHLDHVVKSVENRGKYATGSERKIGQCDVHLGLDVVKALHRGASGLVKITTHKDRFGWLPRPHACEMHLMSDSEHRITWTFKATATEGGETQEDDWRPTWYMEEVSKLLERQTAPMARGAIVTTIGRKRPRVLEAIDFLIADGYATETPGPRGSKLTASVQPFRVPDPFPPVPGNRATSPVPAFPPPLGGNADGNGSDVDPEEVERLLADHADIAAGGASPSLPEVALGPAAADEKSRAGARAGEAVTAACESLSPVEPADPDCDDSEPVVEDRPVLERAPEATDCPPAASARVGREDGAIPPLDEALDVAAGASATDADALLDGPDADGDAEPDAPPPTPPALKTLEGTIVGGILRASRDRVHATGRPTP